MVTNISYSTLVKWRTSNFSELFINQQRVSKKFGVYDKWFFFLWQKSKIVSFHVCLWLLCRSVIIFLILFFMAYASTQYFFCPVWWMSNHFIFDFSAHLMPLSLILVLLPQQPLYKRKTVKQNSAKKNRLTNLRKRTVTVQDSVTEKLLVLEKKNWNYVYIYNWYWG